MAMVESNKVREFIGWRRRKPASADDADETAFLIDTVQQISLDLEEESERSFAKVTRDLTHLVSHVARLHPIVNKLKTDYAAAQERNTVLETERVQLNERVVKAESELDHYQTLCAKLREQVDALSEREAADRKTLEELQVSLTEAKGEVQELSGKLAFEKRAREEAEKERDELRSRLTKNETDYFRVKREIAKATNDLGALQANLASRELELERTLEDLGMERSGRMQAEGILAQSRRELDELREQLKKSQKSHASEIKSFQEEVKSLKALKTKYENLEVALRAKIVLLQRLLENQRVKTDKAYEHIAHLQGTIRKLISEEAATRQDAIDLDWEPESELVAAAPEEDAEEADSEESANQVVRLRVKERNA